MVLSDTKCARRTARDLKLHLITAILFVTWLVLVLVGKSGFVHLLLLSAIGVGFVDALGVFRSRMTV
jgi:hypothetical protein